MRRSFARTLAAVVTMLVVSLQGTWVLAGTTGTISGVVTDAQSAAPVSGAHVTATAPSQQAATNTDAQGRFQFLSLGPDTYTVTITRAGYSTVTQPGVTVQADNTVNVNLTASKQLQRIGGTTARANTDLVKPGTVSDVYSVNAAQAQAAAGLGGGGSLNQAYSAIASVPGVFVPQGQTGWAQSVYIRGGNYTQLGYEYDGVPVQRAYDAYPSSTLSALGQQEVQVYTGSQPGTAQSSGLAGFVNQVIKTGTYPGTGTGELGLGFPTFYHKGQFEVGGASPDRNFSYYLGGAGYNQATRVVDQFDGGDRSQLYQSTLNYSAIAQNCGNAQATAGCYIYNGFGAAPNGYVWTPLAFGQDPLIGDRETVANFHIGIPHKKDGLKDDIQALADLSYLFLSFNDSYNSYGPQATNFFQNGTLNFQNNSYPLCIPDPNTGLPTNQPCAQDSLGLVGANSFNYFNRSIYTGPTGGALTSANLGQVSPYILNGAPSGVPFAPGVNPNVNGNEKINDGIFKLQYTHAMGANAYARIYGYSLYSDWLNNDPNAIAFVPNDYILPTHTRGIGLTLADQIGNHLLNLTGGYSFANLSRWNNGFPSSANPVAVLVDSSNPTDGLCYNAAQAARYCGSSSVARYVVPGNPFTTPNLVPGKTATGAPSNVGPGGAITPDNASTFTCGGGPCEYLTSGSGLTGSFNNVTPRFANATISDTWNVTPKLTVDAAVRYDSFRYDIPPGGTAEGPNPSAPSNTARTQFNNSYNAFHCFNGLAGVAGIIATATPNSCPAGTQQVAFSTNTPSQFWYGGFQPRIGATFQINQLNVLRAGYGRYLQPTSSAYLFYNRADPNVAAYDAPKFYAYGFTNPSHNIPPQESWNFDFSWEHQIKGSDMSFKMTPFIRRTRNENINVVLDAQTNFVSGIDALSSNVRGIEFLFRKGDFSRNGFAGQLAYTYTYETSKYQILPGGGNALSGVNQAVQQYNGYTSFCATNPTDKRCGTPTNGVAAAPCYTTSVLDPNTGVFTPSAPAPGCGAGTVANPYWNAPVQPLFDPNADYFPYNQTFGTGFSSNASSYNIPHVATLILNYKHDKWSFTPTMQFTAGGRYGSPVQGIGIDPATGCNQTLAGGTIAGDPRYPYGAPGGSPYLAQTCNGFITAPNPDTGRFDKPGAFTEPSQISTNLGIGYQANKRLKLNLLAVNVFGTCFGGSREPWTNYSPKIGCWYGSASGLQAGNIYNPGNAFENQAQPYFPVIGGIAGQQAYGTNVQPLQVFLSAQLKL